MPAGEADLIQEFVTEAREHLSGIEPDLLLLEKEGKGVGPEVVNRIFRAIHSIKGAAGFFGFELLKSLSHVMESVLMLVRDGQINPTPRVVEPLLKGVDRLNDMIKDVNASETVNCERELTWLNQLLSDTQGLAASENDPDASEQGGAVTLVEPVLATYSDSSTGGYRGNDQSASPLGSVVPSVDGGIPYCRAALEESVRFGHHVYRLELLTDTDLAKKNRQLPDVVTLLQSAGMVYTDSPISREDDAGVTLLYSSVLEADLLCHSFQLDASRLTPVDWDNLPDAASSDSQSKANRSLQPTPESVPIIPHVATAPPASALPTGEKGPISQKGRKPGVVSPDGHDTVRVRVDLLNRMMDLAGEMVLSRNQLLSALESSKADIPGLSGILQNVDLITSDLQEHIMQTRMQTVGTVFSRFPRVVRDLARTLGKSIELDMAGEDVELDKSIIESLSDPLTHLIRNCCDHGIETPAIRQKAGKPASGRIQLRAYHEGGQINIEITDDGKGIDPYHVAQKALLSGAVSEADLKRMSLHDMVQLIFLPGLSTAETVSDVSGRGVGMDVVRTNIEQIGGSVQINSQPGVGTTMRLRLPLTLAIIPSLIVGVGGQKFAMPQVNVVEMVRIPAADTPQRIEQVGSATILRLRGSLLPLVDLATVLGVQRRYQDDDGQTRPDRRQHLTDARLAALTEEASRPVNRRRRYASDVNIMLLSIGKHRYGLVVDELFDIEEIVVKPLSVFMKNSRCFSGATIMGDGRVAMILDAGGIVQTARLSFTEPLETPDDQTLAYASVEDNPNRFRQAVILFNVAPDEQFAIPLNTVLRLEKIRLSDIEQVGSQSFLPYRGRPLPLLRLEDCLPIGCSPPNQPDAYVILPKTGHPVNGADAYPTVGLLVSRIEDTLQMDVSMQNAMMQHPGVLGAALLGGHMTVFIDTERLLEAAGYGACATV